MTLLDPCGSGFKSLCHKLNSCGHDPISLHYLQFIHGPQVLLVELEPMSDAICWVEAAVPLITPARASWLQTVPAVCMRTIGLAPWA